MSVKRAPLRVVAARARCAAGRCGRDETDDRGITLLEVVVAMMVMSVFMAIVTTGMLQVYRTVNATDARATAQAQIQIAFLRLDKQIRYAKRITTPTLVGSKWYVEYLIYRKDPTSSGPPWKCHALRLNGTRLEVLSWDKDGTPDPTKFVTLVAGVRASDSAAGPFPPPATVSGANDLQRLRLALTASAGANSTAASGSLDITFTALNSLSAAKENDPPDTKTETVCTQERQP